MKTILIAGATLVAVATGAQAAAMATYNSLPATGSYFAPTAAASSGFPTYQENVTGSIDGLRTSPFFDTTSAYDSVENGGYATFAASTFGASSNSFTFVWGTPDDYNKITFLSGGAVVGDALFGKAGGTGSFLATVTNDVAFDAVRFESISNNAFEFAAVAPVPLPTTLPLFGGAVLLVGLVGYKKRKLAAQA